MAGPDEQGDVGTPDEPTGWRGRVAFGGRGRNVAFRPGELILPEADYARLQESASYLFTDWTKAGEMRGFTRLRHEAWDGLPGADDATIDSVRRQTLELVDDLRLLGVRASFNHVVIAHQGVTANPFTANPFTANPFTANPFTANPFTANPFTANPFTANAFMPNTWPALADQATGIRRSTARPAPQPADPGTAPQGVTAPRVLVLDTGRPTSGSAALLPGIAAGQEQPDEFLLPTGAPGSDARIDPVAGHGLFIGGVIARIAPGADIDVVRVLDGLGAGDEWDVSRVLLERSGQFDLVNLSFGTYDPEQPHLLATAVADVQRGRVFDWDPDTEQHVLRRDDSNAPVVETPAIVVASAGNDATWVPPFPASLPDVVAVAALDEHERGPAWYSNYGPWVSACAPGTDVVSNFWTLDTFERVWTGGAAWSGTSFAAPYVVGVLARTMQYLRLRGQTVDDATPALNRVIDEPDLQRIPWHGTVVRGF